MNTDFLVIVGSYFVVFLATFLVFNFFTKGILWTWLRVLLSRGRSILVQVRGPIKNYWITGKLAGDKVIVKDYESKAERGKKTLILGEGVVYRTFGVSCVYYDEATNELIKPDLSNVAGFDLLKFDNLNTRALMRPQNEEDKRFRMIVYVGLAVLVIIGGLIYFRLDEVAKLITAPAVTGGVLNGFIGFRVRR